MESPLPNSETAHGEQKLGKWNANETRPAVEGTGSTLMMKAWSHGQILGALQCVAYGHWALMDGSVSGYARLAIILCTCFLPVWTMCSWTAMQQNRENPQLILGFGMALEFAYMGILTGALKWKKILVATFTGLQMMETFAYLLIVTYVMRSFLHGGQSTEGINKYIEVEEQEPNTPLSKLPETSV